MRISIFLSATAIFALPFAVLSGDAGNEKKLVALKSGPVTANGFVAICGGKKYIFTSAHAIGKGGLTALSTCDGKSLRIGAVEFASDRDIVRISSGDLAESFPEIFFPAAADEAMTVVSVEPDPQNPSIFKSKTSGLKVSGIGPENLMLGDSSKNMSLLTGSPVVNKQGAVVGVLTIDVPALEYRKDDKGGGSFAVNWGAPVCARFSGDVKWISCKLPEVNGQLKPLADAKAFIDESMPLISMWYKNPLSPINSANPPEELQPWLKENNENTENNQRYIKMVKSDPAHFQEMERQTQVRAETSGRRLASFVGSKATAAGKLNLTPYLKLYGAKAAEFYEEVSETLTCRSKYCTYRPVTK